jgi:hypothetical protein
MIGVIMKSLKINLYILFLLFISLNICFSLNGFPGINNTLVVIDEQENGLLQKSGTPFTDGVIDALWTSDKFIF